MGETPKTRRRWLRFSLRSLLILVTIAGIGLAFVVRWHQRAIRQRAAVAALEPFAVTYDESFDPSEPPLVPWWFFGLVGYDHLHNVVEVTLYEATDHQMALVSDFPGLQKLILDTGTRCGEAGYLQIRSLKNLRHLEVHEAPELNDRAMTSIASVAGLEHLHLHGRNSVTDDGMAELARLTRLKSLHLHLGESISDRGLAKIGRIQNLEELDLFLDHYPRPVTVDALGREHSFAFLGNLMHLTSLHVNGAAASIDEAVSNAAKIPDLKELQICARGFVTDEAFANVEKLTHLQKLVLLCFDNHETDAGLAHLAHMPNLTWLELRLGPEVSDTGLESLSTCTSLQRLRLLVNDRITGDGLRIIEQLKYLELDLATRSASAPPLRLQLPADIEILEINGPATQQAGGLTDEDLAGLVGLTKLRQLRITSCTRLTDKGLEHLKQLQSLRGLEILGCTGLTSAGSAGLRAALPNCKDAYSDAEPMIRTFRGGCPGSIDGGT